MIDIKKHDVYLMFFLVKNTGCVGGIKVCVQPLTHTKLAYCSVHYWLSKPPSFWLLICYCIVYYMIYSFP